MNASELLDRVASSQRTLDYHLGESGKATERVVIDERRLLKLLTGDLRGQGLISYDATERTYLVYFATAGVIRSIKARFAFDVEIPDPLPTPKPSPEANGRLAEYHIGGVSPLNGSLS